MNISSINGLGNVSNLCLKNNSKSNYISLKEDQPDTFEPSFKAVKLAAVTKPKTLALGTMLGLAALFGCKKDDADIYIPNQEDICMCASMDFTEPSRYLVNVIPENDTLGRDAYLNWYNANLETYIEPECCHNIMPVDPKWDNKCERWIDNYVLINKIPPEDTFGRQAYVEWYSANFDANIENDDWSNMCQEWIDNYLAGEDICG